MPRILHVTDTDPGTWPAMLGRATTLGFDTLLLPQGAVPASTVEAAAGLRVSLLTDMAIDRAPEGELDAAPFTRLLAPSLDPRATPASATEAHVAISTLEDAIALARWWSPRIGTLRAAGVVGVRLLGLDRLPGWAVPTFAAALRDGSTDAVLFGWTPGVAQSVLEALPPRAFDLVACSLRSWDGQSDRLWRELEALRRIAPVVADAGDDPVHQALAAVLSEGWMALPNARDAARLNKVRRTAFGGLPWSRLVSPPGSPVVVMLRTDAPDPRASHKAALAATALADAAPLSAATVLEAIDGDFARFHPVQDGAPPLDPGAALSPTAGGLLVYTAVAHARPAPESLSRKRAEAAAAMPRVAIEAPSPSVENGRFPARQVVGGMVTVACDVVGDGHDKFAAMLRWQAPGSEEWTEVAMAHVVNDRWTARFPLERMGLHRYAIEAWRDAYATFVDELEKKHAAGVPIALELQEGTALVEAAAARLKKPVRAALDDVLRVLRGGDMDARRTALLAAETRAAMARADDRPNFASCGPLTVQAERVGAGFASWYEIFPRSMSDDPARHGTFRDVVRHLPRIEAMGFDVLYFPPIHPIGHKNRKGPNNTLTPEPGDPGSPYAIGSEAGGHDAIHPELGSLEDFQHLRAEASKHGIELAIDFAIQCSPDHPWLQQHKDWFTWRPDGTIRYAENPPKRYEDIVNVDFYAPGAVPDLWMALANAVLFWAEQGVRLFRVDNPHTKPLPFWEWMIAEVQARYPDAVFLAEAFTRPKVMYRLAKAGFSQSYTYFTWRNTRLEFEDYLKELTEGPPRDFFRPHFFVNTPDINPVPLQTASRSGFLTRAALAATLAGLWGVYCGFELCEATPVPGREEYLDSEKYQIRAWDWDRPGNIVREIGALNAIRKLNPALHSHLGVTFLDSDNPQVLAFEKATPDRSNVLLIAINMDLATPQGSTVSVPFWRWTAEPTALDAIDLVRGRQERWTDRSRFLQLTADQPYAIWRITPSGAFA